MMQFSKRKKADRKKNALVNAVVPGLLALAAIALIIAWQSGAFRSDNADLTEDEIAALRASISTPLPASFAPTDASAPSPAPADASSADVPGDGAAAAYVFITLDNRTWGIEPLGEERDVTVDQGNGVVNVIHLLPNGYYMKSSTCDNQLCVQEGTVTVDNYQHRMLGACVYCLPHELVLELVVPGATADPNAPDR